MMKTKCQHAITEREICYKHSVGGHDYNSLKKVWADKCCCSTMFSTSRSMSHTIYMSQCSTEENVTLTYTKYIEHSQFNTEIPKISCMVDFKINFLSDCMFPSLAGRRELKKTRENSSPSKMKIPLLSVQGAVNKLFLS